MGLPSDIPVVTPCQQLFCRACLHEALSHQCCHTLSSYHCKMAVWRIWSSIRVKCGNDTNGCAWHNGQNASSHELRESRHFIDELMPKNIQLKEELDEARRQIQLKESLFSELVRMSTDLDPRTLGLFNDNYNFGRCDVVRLSQLIVSRLEHKPHYINSNKIFDCVQAFYRDWNAGYRDNPQHYHLI
ncbi:LOW QUALITY PROTEIN: hypothetical protein ACHAWO_012206 [Cyclotella atomus]|uniref:RING-type domain-containing protein n=1 Tax=Cyclotella atomus TaxID=382360 RepID=A0ABD3PD89_9STRA